MFLIGFEVATSTLRTHNGGTTGREASAKTWITGVEDISARMIQNPAVQTAPWAPRPDVQRLVACPR